MTPSDKFIPTSWLPYVRRGDSRIIAEECDVNPHYAWQWLSGHREWQPQKQEQMLMSLGKLVKKRKAVERAAQRI